MRLCLSWLKNVSFIKKSTVIFKQINEYHRFIKSDKLKFPIIKGVNNDFSFKGLILVLSIYH